MIVGHPFLLGDSKLFDALAGGHAGILVFAKVDTHTVVIPMIQFLVLFLQLFIALSGGIVQALARLRFLIACDILVVDDIGTDGNIESGLVGSLHGELAVGLTGLSALRLHRHATLKANLSLQVLMLGSDTRQRGFLPFATNEHIRMGRVERSRE